MENKKMLYYLCCLYELLHLRCAAYVTCSKGDIIMKKTKILALILIVAMACMLFAACGGGKSDKDEWTREGYFTNEDENMLSVMYMEDVDDPGWYVGFMNGENTSDDSYGGIVEVENGTLHGTLNSFGPNGDLVITVSEEGEDGLMAVVEGGEEYHFAPMDMPDATIIVHVNTEGDGNIEYAEGETTPEINEEYPYQSAQINLAGPETYTFLAWPAEGYKFVKWTKNGEDFSEEAQITVALEESADFVAVFEEE